MCMIAKKHGSRSVKKVQVKEKNEISWLPEVFCPVLTRAKCTVATVAGQGACPTNLATNS